MDLTTPYLGITLKHPIVASSSPLSKSLDGILKLEDAGASAIVLFSLFEEQIKLENEALEHLSAEGQESFHEVGSYFPEIGDFRIGPDGYLDLIRKAKEATEIPIIASLNGLSDAGWSEYAELFQQAGADAIELNIFTLPTSFDQSGQQVEERYLDIVRTVRKAVTIPIAVKMHPYFSAVADMASRLVQAGANGLVLFNRFYQPDFDLETMRVQPQLHLSEPTEIRLPLLWTGVLHGRLECSLAATTGVRTHVEAAKYLLAGSDAVMTTSSLLRNGAGHVEAIVSGLTDWMESKGYSSVAQMKGSMSQSKSADPAAFVRANYIKVLETYAPSMSK